MKAVRNSRIQSGGFWQLHFEMRTILFLLTTSNKEKLSARSNILRLRLYVKPYITKTIYNPVMQDQKKSVNTFI